MINLLNFILELNLSVRKLAAERFRKAKQFVGREPKTDCLPSLPLHSERKLFMLGAPHLKTVIDMTILRM